MNEFDDKKSQNYNVSIPLTWSTDIHYECNLIVIIM